MYSECIMCKCFGVCMHGCTVCVHACVPESVCEDEILMVYNYTAAIIFLRSD